MRTQIILFNLIWFFLSGCTSTFLIKDKPDSIILKAAKPGNGQIILKNGKIHDGFNIQISSDSTSWSEEEKINYHDPYSSNQKKVLHKISTSEIIKIIIHKDESCALEGYGVGALVGIGIGSLIGLASGDDDSILIGILYSGLISPITGLIGMAIGSNTPQEEFIVYNIEDLTQGDKTVR